DVRHMFLYVCVVFYIYLFFFSSRRRHTRFSRDWSSDVCSSDLELTMLVNLVRQKLLLLQQKILMSSHLSMNLCSRLLKDLLTLRSEERRVGKECRSRWWRHHYKQNWYE